MTVNMPCITIIDIIFLTSFANLKTMENPIKKISSKSSEKNHTGIEYKQDRLSGIAPMSFC